MKREYFIMKKANRRCSPACLRRCASKMMNLVFKTRSCVLTTKNCVLKTRNFVLKMMNSAGLSRRLTRAWRLSVTRSRYSAVKIMEFVLETTDCVLKLTDSVLKMMDFVLKMMNFVQGRTAYISQSAWFVLLHYCSLVFSCCHFVILNSYVLCVVHNRIQNLTLRENILFGKPYDKHKYDGIIKACALGPVNTSKGS